jgi:hypothetical protein
MPHPSLHPCPTTIATCPHRATVRGPWDTPIYHSVDNCPSHVQSPSCQPAPAQWSTQCRDNAVDGSTGNDSPRRPVCTRSRMTRMWAQMTPPSRATGPCGPVTRGGVGGGRSAQLEGAAVVAAPPLSPRRANPCSNTAGSRASRPPVGPLPPLRRRPPHPSPMATRTRKRLRASEHSLI